MPPGTSCHPEPLTPYPLLAGTSCRPLALPPLLPVSTCNSIANSTDAYCLCVWYYRVFCKSIAGECRSKQRRRMLPGKKKQAPLPPRLALSAATLVFLLSPAGWAGEGPFFITYTHQMEEPGNLELSTKSVTGKPAGGSRFLANSVELEYGVKGWWTTELYLDGQSTRGENSLFTGYRWENRFRLQKREHWINPVLYFEFENINGADKSLLEVVNRDGQGDLMDPASESRLEKKRELEAKLILGSYFKGWTIAENFIAEKNIRHEPFEFGYAVGVSRPLALTAGPDKCAFCRENFQAGLEVYGGLGTHSSFGLNG